MNEITIDNSILGIEVVVENPGGFSRSKHRVYTVVLTDRLLDRQWRGEGRTFSLALDEAIDRFDEE